MQTMVSHNKIKTRQQTDSVRDCLMGGPRAPTSAQKYDPSANYVNNLPSESHQIGSNFIFGMPTKVLNKKDGRLFSENGTGGDIMSRSKVQKTAMSEQDMGSQRTREEVG